MVVKPAPRKIAFRTPTILIAIATTVLAVIAGCNLFGNVQVPEKFRAFDAVVGMKITINVTVSVELSEEYIDGSTHYRIFTVKVSSDGIARTTAVCSRQPINPPQGVEYEIFSNDVGLWNGLRWYNNGFTDETSDFVTTDQSTVYGEEVYDIPKPGRYLTVFGVDFSLDDLKNWMGDSKTKVPSFLRFSFQDKIGDMLNGISDAKIPFLAELPNYNDNHQSITKNYQVQFYLPLGGRLFGGTSDGYQFKFYETSQRFKVGYDKPSWVDVSVPVWQTWLAAGAAAVLVPGIGQVAAFTYIAASAFMYDWDDEITLLRWDKNLVPIFVALDANPASGTLTKTIDISIDN